MKNGFKETEIGDIPVDWEVVRLGDVITEIISGDWGQAKVENVSAFAKCKVIRGTDFANVQRLSFHAVPERFVKRNSIEKRQIKPGDLLIEISGGSKNQPTGRTLFVSSEMLQKVEYPILFTNFVKLLRLDSEVCDASYFYRFWIYLYDLGRTSIYEKRTTGIRNFKYKDFIANEKLLLPSIPEQQKIANVLSTIQQAIEQQDKIIASVRELTKTLMRKLFTEGLGDAELKETEVGMMPKHWDVVRLGEIAKKTTQTNPRSNPEEKFQYVDVSSVSNDKLRIESYSEYFGKDAPSRARKIVKAGDIIFATVRPYLKRVAMVPEYLDEERCSTAFCVIRCKSDKAYPMFIFQVVTTDVFVERIAEYQRGSSYPAVTDKDVLNQEIPLPPLSEQQDIARILSTVDKKIEVEENRKRLLQELFKTMLHKLMTGQIRVKDLDLEV